MPNNLRPDFVSPHAHSPLEIQGLIVALFPPTQSPEAVTPDPTKSGPGGILYSTLSEMTVDITPPDWYPLWEADVVFTGTFSSDTAGEGAQIQLQVDGVEIPNTTRLGESIGADFPFQLPVQGVTVLQGGQTYTIRVVWASTDALATATARDVQRKLDVTLRPLGEAP